MSMRSIALLILSIIEALDVSHAIGQPDQLVPKSGFDLYLACTYEQGTTGRRICDTYLTGFIDGAVAGLMGVTHPIMFCLPSGVSAEQARAVFMRRMSNREMHRELDDMSAPTALQVTLALEYPCEKHK